MPLLIDAAASEHSPGGASCEIAYNHEVISLQQSPTAVRVTVRTNAGTTKTLSSKYAIACELLNSTCRCSSLHFFALNLIF